MTTWGPPWRAKATARIQVGNRNPIGASAKILYCWSRGLDLSASLSSSIELFPTSARGRTITRINRLGRSAAAWANIGAVGTMRMLAAFRTASVGWIESVWSIRSARV